MNDIQKAIDIVQKFEDNSSENATLSLAMEEIEQSKLYAKEQEELSFVKQVLTSFLKTANESNHTDCANSANAVLGEVPQGNDLPTQDIAGAGCSETGAVRQNEQKEKSCLTCKHNGIAKINKPCCDCWFFPDGHLPLWEAKQD